MEKSNNYPGLFVPPGTLIEEIRPHDLRLREYSKFPALVLAAPSPDLPDGVVLLYDGRWFTARILS